MRLIDADTVITIQVYDDMTEETDTKKMSIADAIDEWSDEGCPPTIEAEPIKHGHWEYVKKRLVRGGYVDANKCSICHKIIMPHLKPNYCPYCGAKMDGDDT